MSVSTQYAPGTPFPTEFLDMNIFESCFVENLGRPQDGDDDSPTHITSNTSSSASAADTPRNSTSTARSTPPPGISPATPTSPSLFSASITKNPDIHMDNMWGSVPNFNLSDFNPTRNDYLEESPTAQAGYMFPVLPPPVPSLPPTQTLTGQPSPPYSALDHFDPARPISTAPYQHFNAPSYSATSRTVHGQVTPPNVESEPVFTEDIFGDHRSDYTDGKGNEPASPRKQCALSPPKQPSTTGRRSRKATASPSKSKEQEELQEAKRRKFLERNRVAASKCRQKKKAWMQQLEENARNAQNNSKILHQTVGILKNELLILKSELLKHHECDCEKIRAYLLREADKVAEGTVGRSISPIRPRQLSLAESEASDLFNEGTELDMLDDELNDHCEAKARNVSRARA